MSQGGVPPIPPSPPVMPYATAHPFNQGPDLTGTVTGEVRCKKCGYNLHGLPLSGRCPECGAPVGVSVHGNLLRFCNPQWVRTLHHGVRMILYGIVVIVAAVVLAIVLAFAISEAAAIAGGVLAIGGYVLIFIGFWKLTEPDPSGLGEDEYGTARKIIRVALLIGLVSTVMDLVASAAEPLSPTMRLTYGSLSFVFGIAELVGLFAQLQYIKKLSLRIPDQAIANRAHFLTYALGISYGIIIVVGVIFALSTGVAGGGAPGGAAMGGVAALGCIMAIVGLAMLVFLVMYLFMLINLGRRLAESATVAEQIWGGTHAAPTPGHPALG